MKMLISLLMIVVSVLVVPISALHVMRVLGFAIESQTFLLVVYFAAIVARVGIACHNGEKFL